MVETDLVAIQLVAVGGVIDEMEACSGVFGTQDLKDLAVYQAKLSTARTSLTQDAMSLEKFTRYYNVKKGKK